VAAIRSFRRPGEQTEVTHFDLGSIVIHRAPDLSWRPAVAARVEAWRLRRRIVRAARALVALVLGMLP
jgi:hypothetical protein